MMTSPKAVNSGQTEREAFEAELAAGTFDVDRVSDFANCETEAAWRGWQARAAAPQGLTDDLQRRVHRALMSAHPNLAREFAEQSPAPASPSGEDAAEQAAAPVAEHGYCQARANNEDCNCASACARWVPAPLPRASEQADEAVTDAARDVLAERQRQVTAEGWTPEHDEQHDGGEMSSVAACYALSASGWTHFTINEFWPPHWLRKWWKPSTPRRDLVKAGALILAEIERLDRADSAKEQS